MFTNQFEPPRASGFTRNQTLEVPQQVGGGNQAEPQVLPQSMADFAQASNFGTFQDPFANVPRPVKEQVVLEWEAPSRVYTPRNKQVFSTVAAMVFLISLILFFLNQFLLVAVALAIAFLYYVLNTVPPSSIRIAITNLGIRVENELYYWEELGLFWIEQKSTHTMLYVEVSRFPFRLSLLIAPEGIPDIVDVLENVLINQKPKPTYFERAAEWLERLIPLEMNSEQ